MRQHAEDLTSRDRATNPHPVIVAGAPSAPCDDYDADIVILALDRADETIAAIRSALSQTGVSRHVFIVDQGSKPANLALSAAEVADRPDATLVVLDRNYGVAGGRNRGSALGHGRIIFGLDNDAEFASSTTLAKVVAMLDADTMLAAIGCRIVLHSNGEDDMSSWGYPPGLLARSADNFDAITFVGAGHAIRRSAWQACNGYDDDLHFCWEELAFACARSSRDGASAITATSSSATRSALSSALHGRAAAGSTTCAIGSTSAASGHPAGCRCCRAASSMRSRVPATARCHRRCGRSWQRSAWHQAPSASATRRLHASTSGRTTERTGKGG
jgi:hypothetical protein